MSVPINASPAALQRMLCASVACDGQGALSLQDGMIFDLAEWVQGDEAKVAVFTCEDHQSAPDMPAGAKAPVLDAESPGPLLGESNPLGLLHPSATDAPRQADACSSLEALSALEAQPLGSAGLVRPIKKNAEPLGLETPETTPVAVQRHQTEPLVPQCPSHSLAWGVLPPQAPPQDPQATGGQDALPMLDPGQRDAFAKDAGQGLVLPARQEAAFVTKAPLGPGARAGGAFTSLNALGEPGQEPFAKAPVPTEAAAQNQKAAFVPSPLGAPVGAEPEALQRAEPTGMPSVLSVADRPSVAVLKADQGGADLLPLSLEKPKDSPEGQADEGLRWLPARYPELALAASSQRAGLSYRMPSALPVHPMARYAALSAARHTLDGGLPEAQAAAMTEELTGHAADAGTPLVAHASAAQPMQEDKLSEPLAAEPQGEAYGALAPEAPSAQLAAGGSAAQDAFGNQARADLWQFQPDKVSGALVPYIVEYVSQLQDYAGQWRRMPVRLEGKAAGALIFKIEGKTLSLSLRDAGAGISGEIMSRQSDLVAYASELGLALHIEGMSAMPPVVAQPSLAYLA